MMYYKYGIFKKGGWKAIILFKTKKEAESYLKFHPKGSCEVRKLIS